VRDADDLRAARLVVSNGLGLEGHLDDALESAAADGVQVHEVGESLADHLDEPADGEPADAEPAEDHANEDHADEDHANEDGDAHEGHGHEGEDPHLWMDPLLVAEAVPGIAAALGQVDDLGVAPEDLDRCAADYAEQLRALVTEVDQRLAAVPEERRKIVTDHEALGHFAERFDLEVVGALVPSTDSLAEANPRDLDELEAAMRTGGVEVVVVEHGSSRGLAESLTRRVGGEASVVELFTESIGADGAPQSYVELLRTDGRVLAEALAP
jgi:ABC-type Zn uptake system ZnuABC Zn-binding protein ZnuA